MAKQSKKPTKGRNEKGQFTVGNDGRGKKWSTPEALQKDIDAYFKRCDDNTKVELIMGKFREIPHPLPYSIEGLAVALDVDRMTLKNYEKRKGYEPFFAVIKKARDKVLANMVERASNYDSHASFTQFLMKNNYGFVDRQEIENTGDTIVIQRPQKPK